MNTPHIPTHVGGAGSVCPEAIDSAFYGVGTIAQQPHFPPVTRRDLMTAVNTAGRSLGLRAASVVVLDALLSCLPCQDAKTGKDAPITPMTLLTVFASNDTLCFRAKGITDRQLRRHLDKLETANLVKRRDSANGKRFPILRKGKVIGAFGIDLSPLLARSSEILALSQVLRDEADEFCGLRTCVQNLRNACLQRSLEPATRAFVAASSTILRRVGTSLSQAVEIVTRLKSILDDTDPTYHPAGPIVAKAPPVPEIDQSGDHTTEAVSAEMTAADGQNVRHKETQKPYTRKPKPISAASLWGRLHTIPDFYPDAPGTAHEWLQLLFTFGRMLRIEQGLLARAVNVLGLSETLLVTDHIAARADEIGNPNGYLSRIMACGFRQAVGHGQLR